MQASIECAHAGGTTGEWTETLRKIYGEYRAPTGRLRFRGVTPPSYYLPTGILLLLVVRRVQALEVNQGIEYLSALVEGST